MSLEKEVALLRKVSLLSTLDDAKLKLLAFTSNWVQFNPGEALCHEGEAGDAAFLITEGEVEVAIDTEDGELVVARRGANDVIGEISIVCDVPRTATVRAATPVRTVRIAKEVFLQLLNGSPHLAIEVIRILAARVDRLTRELRDAKTRPNTD